MWRERERERERGWGRAGNHEILEIKNFLLKYRYRKTVLIDEGNVIRAFEEMR